MDNDTLFTTLMTEANTTFTVSMFGLTACLYVLYAMFTCLRDNPPNIIIHDTSPIIMQGVVFCIFPITWWALFDADLSIAATFWMGSWLTGMAITLGLFFRLISNTPDDQTIPISVGLPIIIPHIFPFIMMVIWKLNM